MAGKSDVMQAKLDAVEDVKIDPSGRFKYVLIKLYIGEYTKYIVRGYKWAEYHADIYEREESSIIPLGIETECVGGGRIDRDESKKTIFVYGYSMVEKLADSVQGHLWMLLMQTYVDAEQFYQEWY